MDTKSLARSKRAHSQHLNKKHNPKPKSKPTATSASTPSDSDPKKPSSGKQPPKPRASSSRLPSNWDRYEDELDSSSDAVPVDQSAKSKTSDVVLPKSKGADYGWLISEARSQMESRTVGDFSSFDDALPDIFQQGLCSMLTVRGNGILSWTGNDNFIVDDSSVSGDEASFLSLDLHAVASKLEKLDISRRLFIEADILPSQLDVNESKETIQHEPEQSENRASGAAEQFLNESASLERSNEKTIHHNTMLTPSNATSNYSSLPTPRQMKDDSIQIEHCTSGEVVDSISRINVNDTKITKDERNSKFEASAAEAELDMLLNSFGETNLDSPGESKKSVTILPTSQWDDSPMLPKGDFVRQPSEQGFNSSKSAVMNFDLDDTIDDLLRETSDIKNPNNAVNSKETVTPQFAPTSSANSTGGLDDFDAWLETI